MFDLAEYLGNRARIQRRTVGGDAFQGLLTGLKHAFEAFEEPGNILMSWIVPQGTNTRLLRHKCQLAVRYGKPSSTTSRTAMPATRCVYRAFGNAKSLMSALK